jgi:hypothetical protein
MAAVADGLLYVAGQHGTLLSASCRAAGQPVRISR